MQQPGEYDAVLGSQTQTPEFAAILGGIEGMKLRLSNANPQVRIVSLQEVLKYGDAGLDLLIQALNDESLQVQNAAYSLLKSRTEVKVRQALRIFDEEQLKSAVGMDYKVLRDLLAKENWKEAHEETERVIFAVAQLLVPSWGRPFWLTSGVHRIPCQDLRTIDRLWVKSSSGRFGFSAQNRIYQNLRKTKTSAENLVEIYRAFLDRVGWRKDNYWCYYSSNFTHDITAPVGHLPFLKLYGPPNYRDTVEQIAVIRHQFFSYIENCEL
jgi:hypothetical protein